MSTAAILTSFLIVVVVVAAAIWIVYVRTPAVEAPATVTDEEQTDNSDAGLPAIEQLGGTAAPITTPAAEFTPQVFAAVKTPHFVSSQPENNAVLASSPSSVNINFNFDLGAGSSVQVLRDGVTVSSGTSAVSVDKLSMSVPVQANQPGNYAVSYTACWPDGSCHNGSFGFTVQ